MKKIILILVLLIFIIGCSEQIEESNEEKSIGGETDEHGCLGPAGYQWCPSEQKCMRMWEEYCEEYADQYKKELEPSAEEVEIVCTDYDGNQQECLSHPECKWTSGENICEPIGQVEEEDEEVEEKGFTSELEKDLPDTIPNEICKQLPLTNELSPGDKYNCLAVVNNNPEFCELIVIDNEQDIEAKNEKNLCLAHSKQDVSYCKKMSDNAAKKDCYFGLSLISENIDICDGITYDKDEKQLCYFSFVNTLYWEDRSDKITTTHCNKLPEPDRSTCLAYKDRDVSLCRNKVNCLTFFEQPMSFCEGRGSSLIGCVRDRAMTNKDLSICETLTGEERDDCISDFAGHISQDILTCDKITSDFTRNTCYKDVAIQSGWLKG